MARKTRPSVGNVQTYDTLHKSPFTGLCPAEQQRNAPAAFLYGGDGNMSTARDANTVQHERPHPHSSARSDCQLVACGVLQAGADLLLQDRQQLVQPG
eukprot:CAMPEP_0175673838 /NCGR_PEP_ID=MMETSP0097-20121207/21404_1 /TAXON_ID=311494 /ORGANISM="Alexandrium monilatum, Strain CCMP3105" /LENGTH=97 /DNA_ID=CAMNT_0016980501 /DNA_START=154 /DNA_END=443 /DNA_ORIENTATION=-